MPRMVDSGLYFVGNDSQQPTTLDEFRIKPASLQLRPPFPMAAGISLLLVCS
jgi:hypothetical protein